MLVRMKNRIEQVFADSNVRRFVSCRSPFDHSQRAWLTVLVMNISSPQIIGDEPRSLTPEPNHAGSRTPRRSHVSISSSKRPSMNAGASNSNKVKQGMFRRAVPQMPRALACICFVCNLVLPGTGMNYLSLASDTWHWMTWYSRASTSRALIWNKTPGELSGPFHFVGSNEDDTFEETTDHSCCRQHRHYSARLVIRISSFLTSLLSCVVRVFFFLLITDTYPYISSSRTHQHGFYTNSADTRQLVSLNFDCLLLLLLLSLSFSHQASFRLDRTFFVTRIVSTHSMIVTRSQSEKSDRQQWDDKISESSSEMWTDANEHCRVSMTNEIILGKIHHCLAFSLSRQPRFLSNTSLTSFFELGCPRCSFFLSSANWDEFQWQSSPLLRPIYRSMSRMRT